MKKTLFDLVTENQAKRIKEINKIVPESLELIVHICEEAAELIKAVSKVLVFKKKDEEHLAEEIVDVLMCLDYLATQVDPEVMKEALEKKISKAERKYGARKLK